MTRIVLLFVALFAFSATANLISAAPEMKLLWNSWKQLNNKVYSEVEEVKRFGVFVENYFKIVTHNAKDADVKLALNHFADLTSAEFKASHLNGLMFDQRQVEHNQIREKIENNNFLGLDYSILSVPATVDWRTKGAVTPVKDQGQCGSCWSFSSTGALEGLNFVKTGKLLSFSEQQLVDCDKTDNGCNGGLMTNAFAYTAKQGIQLESDYPYTAEDGKCQYNAKKVNKVNKGSKNVATNNVDALKAALVTQPVAVAIEADEQVFQFYSSGVIKSNCGASLDHGVLAVGYTKVNGVEAFIVKNSWNSSWGQQGYVYISTDKKANNGAGVCGISAMASVPTA